MEGQIIHTTDRISHLPEPIIHHIMSFLDSPEEFDLDSPADLVRLSVLSKKWFALTASFPILNFDIRKFETSSLFPHDYLFLKYADYTTSRFCKQNVSAHTFNLIAVIEDPSQLSIIDKCVRLILKKGVKVLLLDIIDKNFSLVYLLPDLLLSATLLTSLTLCNCDLPSALTVDDVKFKSLKLLDLDYVLLDEEMIECLTSNCPLLEEMHLNRCYGFKKICIHGHQNLLKLRIESIHGLKTIDIKAPNLSYLILKLCVERIKRINLASCKKLTTLSFTRYSSETTQVFADFAHFLSNFPFIENLFLTLPSDCDSLKFSSHSLRTIVLYSQCDFDKIDINAPNLLLFEYCGNLHKPNSLVRRLVEPKARIEYYTWNGLDNLWFLKLRRFLNKKNEFKVFKLVLSGEVRLFD